MAVISIIVALAGPKRWLQSPQSFRSAFGETVAYSMEVNRPKYKKMIVIFVDCDPRKREAGVQERAVQAMSPSRSLWIEAWGCKNRWNFRSPSAPPQKPYTQKLLQEDQRSFLH